MKLKLCSSAIRTILVSLLVYSSHANFLGRFVNPINRLTKAANGGSMRIVSSAQNSTLTSQVCKLSPKNQKKLKSCSVSAPESKQKLTYFQTMVAGAVSRTLSQFLVHPINTYKTMMQLQKKGTAVEPISFSRLMKGWDAQLYLSLPNGAITFVVTDRVKKEMEKYIPKQLDFLSDFGSSAVSTFLCSVISTPQMVLADRMMVGMYPTMSTAISEIWKKEGISGFYAGWWPALVQKIPSYGITWVAFQQMKKLHVKLFHKKPSAETNFVLGAAAAAASVSLMIPLDTIKTRITTQAFAGPAVKYTGVVDCFSRILKEEGPAAFYRSLPPRLVSVVPMMALQFGIFEFVKNSFHQHNENKRLVDLTHVQEL